MSGYWAQLYKVYLWTAHQPPYCQPKAVVIMPSFWRTALSPLCTSWEMNKIGRDNSIFVTFLFVSTTIFFRSSGNSCYTWANGSTSIDKFVKQLSEEGCRTEKIVAIQMVIAVLQMQALMSAPHFVPRPFTFVPVYISNACMYHSCCQRGTKYLCLSGLI